MRLFSSVLPLFIIFIIARLEETRDQTAGKENLFFKFVNPIYVDASCGEYAATIRLG
jgi:hypothetical protein